MRISRLMRIGFTILQKWNLLLTLITIYMNTRLFVYVFMVQGVMSCPLVEGLPTFHSTASSQLLRNIPNTIQTELLIWCATTHQSKANSVKAPPSYLTKKYFSLGVFPLKIPEISAFPAKTVIR